MVLIVFRRTVGQIRIFLPKTICTTRGIFLDNLIFNGSAVSEKKGGTNKTNRLILYLFRVGRMIKLLATIYFKLNRTSILIPLFRYINIAISIFVCIWRKKDIWFCEVASSVPYLKKWKKLFSIFFSSIDKTILQRLLENNAWFFFECAF